VVLRKRRLAGDRRADERTLVMDEVVIVTPEVAPGAGGVGDYTLRMIEQWEGRANVRFVIPPLDELQLPERDGRVLVQYSAYGFDQFGAPRKLLRRLRDWKQSGGGVLVMMFHEIWTFWPSWNHNRLLQALHRHSLGKLLPHVDAIFTSTASQAEHLRRLAGGRTVQVLPVGSNVPVVQGDAVRDPGAAVLFGLQGSRLRALRELHEHLRPLAEARRITSLTSVGGGNTAAGERDEREMLSRLALVNGHQQRDALPEEEVSAELSQASFGISAQDELSITKSGTFMAYAAHGLSIISPAADPVGLAPLCWATHPAELLRGVSEDELRERAARLRDWQQNTASWSRIADRFAEALELQAR
jgi:hypothetical protein